MSEIEVGLMAWAVTATLAAFYYGSKVARHQFAAALLANTIREIANGNVVAVKDNDQVRIIGKESHAESK